MAGRLSALHDPSSMTTGNSINPASRNGGSSNAAINGATLDIRGSRGVMFTLHAGILTGAGNYLAYLQNNPTADDDGTNGTWGNVNATTYSNAAVAVKTNANAAFAMSYVPAAGMSYFVRAVLVPDANVGLIGVSHVLF